MIHSKKIAIVGMSHRLPGGDGSVFWDRLVAGEDLVTEVEDGRWAKDKFYHPRKSEPASTYTKASGSLRDVLEFDAGFFGISPREAAQMDPQQRLLMQLLWEALEDAGIKASSLKGTKCGVFVGISSYDYVHRLADDLGAVDAKTPTGNAGSIAANRISYFLDVRGPSMPIDTACSSSLVALHQAWNSLQIGDCDSAIVGGVSLHFHPLGFISFTKTGMLSRDGRCRTFAANADGYVRSEGGGMVILKTLDQAIQDGDRILAVVEGSGINCDGKTNGITVPSGEAQAALLDEVYSKFGIDPEDLDFIEAHGTGTAVGDPIETWAIGQVLGKRRKRPLPLGSVKSNLGHLEAASGMAGLMKVLLMFRHRIIPPNLHYDEPNPRIDFDDLNLRVVTEATPLPPHERLIAGINSFGFGGANAHLVISSPERAQCQDDVATSHSPPNDALPFVISAKTSKALQELATRTADYIAEHPEMPLYDIAHALWMRRDMLPHRALCLTHDRQDLIQSLRNGFEGKSTTLIQSQALASARKPVFVFTGNGAQWIGMGRKLYAESETFRVAVEEVEAIFADYANFSLLPHFQTDAATQLDRTDLAQPLIFAIQVGLVRCLAAAGITPSATLGHSLGEVAAAWAAGALELEQAVKVIRLRSKHQQLSQNQGGMTVVAAPRKEVEALLGHPSLDGIEVVVSGENSPRAVTLAGEESALTVFEAVMQERSMSFKRLDLPYPFHSPQMDAIAQGFASELGELFVEGSNLPFYSTVTGRMEAGPLGTEYWRSNIREPVLFREAVEAAINDEHRVFIEIGPHPVLASHVLHTLQAKRVEGHAVGVITKDQDSAADLSAALWKLILGGVGYDWSRHFCFPPSRVAELPHYPWQMETYALPVSSEGGGLVSNDKEHPLLGYRAHGKDWVWENHLDTTGMPWLADHRVGGSAVFPAAGFLEMALAAGAIRHTQLHVQLENFEIRAPLVFDSRRSKTVRFKLEENSGHFVISSRDRLSEDAWQAHVHGRISSQPCRSQPALPELYELSNAADAADIYDRARQIGLEYGPAFQAVQSVDAAMPVLSATFRVPDLVHQDLHQFLLHPSLIDASFHPLFALSGHAGDGGLEHAFLPVRADRFVLLEAGVSVSSVRCVIRRRSRRSLMADIYLLDHQGSLIAWASGWRFRAAQLVRRSYDRSRTFAQRWISRPRPTAQSAFINREDEIAQRVAKAFDKISDHHLLKRYSREGDPLVDALCTSFAHEALSQMADENGVISLAACVASRKVSPTMQDYFRRLMRMLVEDGWAEPQAGIDLWHLKPHSDIPSVAEIWQALVADFPEKTARFSLIGRMGLHLTEILDDSCHAEELLLKAARTSSGSLHLPMSATVPEIQRILVRVMGELCSELTSGPRRILWVTDQRPAEENFLAPWLHSQPGLLLVLLPEAAESLEVVERFAAYPSVSSIRGVISEDFINSLVRDHGGFDAVVAPASLKDEQCAALADCLLPGGLLFMCAPERSRINDFLPLGSHGRTMSAEMATNFVLKHFGQPRHIPVVSDVSGSSSLFMATKGPAKCEERAVSSEMRCLVISLDLEAASGAELISNALSTLGQSVADLLPPYDAEVSDIWEKMLENYQADHLVLVSAPVATEWPKVSAVGDDLSAVASCLKAASKLKFHGTIHIITQGAFHGDGLNDWMNSALWGFARVARNEFSGIKLRCIDLDSEILLAGDAQGLAREIASHDSDDEILLGAAGRMAARVALDSAEGEISFRDDEKWVLDFDAPGSFQNLLWKRRPAELPGEGEVLISSKAAGLNFRDVMYAMGLLPDEALEGGFAGQTLGMELSGVIKSVGPGVEGLRPGDEVIAFAPASFASEAVTSAGAVIPKPPEISFEAAATIPAAFYTAYHALIELANIQAGERVLIHGAAGGVGIAAVQIAKHAGAEVFATAGNDEKRDFVRLLGADHVFNSRSLDFADEVMAVTNGDGVDVVLNSLAGDAVTKNLEILRPFGRLLELGKRDFYENNRIGLRPFRHNIRYFAVDADQVMALRPDMAAKGFRQVLEMFREKVLSPLPLTVFQAADVAEAFRYMQHSSHTGKVVLDLSDIPHSAKSQKTNGKNLSFSEGTQLVTGGWSGFGLETARWLVSRGARALAILGRSGPSSDAAREFVEECHQKKIQLFAEPCDVADKKSLSTALEKIRSTLPPLRGIFHAATIIEDALIMNMEPAKVHAVVAPKLIGAALLDRMTRNDAIEHFVLYSSATTFFGNPGQAVYVAANTAIEQLAAKRIREGLAATCVSWGPIGDTGYLSRHEHIKDSLASRIGGKPLESTDALLFLEKAISRSESQVAWMDLDWATLSRFLQSANSPRYEMLGHLLNTASNTTENASDLRRQLEGMEPAELLETIKALLREEIANILRVAPESLDENRSLYEIGMDSLMGVELVSSLENNLGITLPIMALSEGPTISRLAERLLHIIKPEGPSEETSDSPLSEQARHLVAQHAPELTSDEIAELVSDIDQSKNS